MRPKNRQQVAELISWVATANHFYFRGYWRIASLMFAQCERILGPLPYVSPESAALGRISFLGYRTANGWSDRYHSLKFKGWVPRVVYRSDEIDGYPALHKCLLNLERRNSFMNDEDAYGWWHLHDGLRAQSVDGRHLERSALRGEVTLQLRWVPVT